MRDNRSVSKNIDYYLDGDKHLLESKREKVDTESGECWQFACFEIEIRFPTQ